MSTKVTTQVELDEALADPAVDAIEIVSPHGVWLTISDDRGKYVWASGMAKVWASGMAKVWASGMAEVLAFETAKVLASETATVRASDSASALEKRDE